MFDFGLLLHFGIGTKQNLSESLQWFQRAAKFGHIGAMSNYGICLYNGIGIKKNLSESVSWFKRALN
jgi:TPR repeat protein